MSEMFLILSGMYQEGWTPKASGPTSMPNCAHIGSKSRPTGPKSHGPPLKSCGFVVFPFPLPRPPFFAPPLLSLVPQPKSQNYVQPARGIKTP